MSRNIQINTIRKLISLSIIGLSLGACNQMMKHSNTLVFTTNTSVGIDIGQDAMQTPSVQIGYQRQEVALVPLYANSAVDDDGKLIPCPVLTIQSADGVVTGTTSSETKECEFIATKSGIDRDAYSVLASFGTKVSGKDSGSMQVAQYFATGIAAQLLAENGGANVVSAGGASEKIAEAAIEASKAKQMEQAAIKERATARLDKGKIGAKAIISDPSGNVTTVKRKLLEDALGDVCTTDTLKAYDDQPIPDLMNFLENRRQRCLRNLASKL